MYVTTSRQMLGALALYRGLLKRVALQGVVEQRRAA